MLTQFIPFKKSFISLAVTTLFFASSVTQACTTVFSNNNGNTKVVARSMDLYMSDQPILVVEPRGTSHDGQAGHDSQTWKSKYGTVNLTAFHTDTVSDGVNEKGLSAHLLYLTGSEYETSNPKLPKISNAMWAKYVLDNYATVNEALKGLDGVQVVATKVHGRIWPIHLVVEDATGDAAVIEFIQGKMQVYHGSQYRVVTNEPAYNIQLENLKRYQGFGGALTVPGGPDPLSRFVRAATFLKTLPKANDTVQSVAGALSVIRTVMVPFGAVDTENNGTVDAWPTRWVTVADLTHRVYYFNSTSAPNLIWIDLNKLNFSEGAKVKTIDPANSQLEGMINQNLSQQTVGLFSYMSVIS